MYSLGQEIWPGACKAVEEMGELLCELGKLMAQGGSTVSFDGEDRRRKLIEEIADARAAVHVFTSLNFTDEEVQLIMNRTKLKAERMFMWHVTNNEVTT